MIEVAFIAIGIVLVVLAYKLGVLSGALKHERLKIMAKISTLADAIKANNDTADKVLAEVTQLKTDFEKLKASLEDVEIPADAQTALDALTTKLSALDAINPDAAPPVA